MTYRRKGAVTSRHNKKKKRAHSARKKKTTGIVPNSFPKLINAFRSVFTVRSFSNFSCIVVGLIMCIGRHTISRIIQFSGVPAQRKHFTVFYKFFYRAKWNIDELSYALCGIVLRILAKATSAGEVILIVDDTLFSRTGSHVWGACMHYDPLSSNRLKGKKSVKTFRFGHNWVIVSIWIPLPWGLGQGLAIPIIFRLYRSKKTCPPAKYKKRTELAKEMIIIVRHWIPKKYKIYVVGDSEYACSELAQNLPYNTYLVGPVRMDAVLYEPLTEQSQKKMGRPRTRGKRLPTPKQLTIDNKEPWQKKQIILYGHRIEILYKTVVVLWPSVAKNHPIRIIVTHDPQGKNKDRAFFCTDVGITPQRIVELFGRRWAAEQMHQQVKEHMGAGEMRNGWWRNKKGRSERVTGSNHKEDRGDKAVLRTAPVHFVAYSLVALWFLKKGMYYKEVKNARKQRPWQKSKQMPSYADMLFAARKEIIEHRLLANPVAHEAFDELKYSLYTLLRAA